MEIGDANGTGCFEIKIRTDAAKFTMFNIWKERFDQKN